MLLFLNTCSSSLPANGHNDFFGPIKDIKREDFSLHKPPGLTTREEGAGILHPSRSGEESADNIFPSSASESGAQEDGCWGRRGTLSSTICGSASSPVGRIGLASEDEDEEEEEWRSRKKRVELVGATDEDWNLSRQQWSGREDEEEGRGEEEGLLEAYVRKKRFRGIRLEDEALVKRSRRDAREEIEDKTREGEDDEDLVQSRVVEDAWEYGMRQMHDLYAVKEPELYKQGKI